MKMIQNYLAEVAAHLPKDNQEDIIAELQSIIEAKLDEKLEETGVEASDKEVADIIKAMGHPTKVAAQYGAQQYLIGPALFLPYKQILKVIVLAVVGIQLLLVLITNALAEDVRISAIGLVFDLAHTALYTGFWVTFAFVMMEYSGEKLEWFKNWDPSKLKNAGWVRADRQDAITNVITDAVIFIWWNNWFGKEHQMPFTPEDFPVMATGVYDAVYWPINFILIASLAIYGWQLFNSYWTKTKLVIAAYLDIMSILVLAYMIQAGDLFKLRIEHNEMDSILEKVNFSVSLTLLIIIGFILYDLFCHLRTWRKL